MGLLENKKKIIELFGTDYKEAPDNELRYNCPFCLSRRGKADKDGKLYANIVKGKFHCFKCGAKGRLNHEKASSTGVYGELLSLFNGYDDDIIIGDEDDNTFYIPNTKIRKGSVAYDYLVSRGMDDSKIKYYDLRLGLDDLFGRIIIPNEIIGSRGIWTDMYSARSYLNQDPKYKNPPSAAKSKIVFNLHRIEENPESVIIVEGAITAIHAGKNAVATYGCHPSSDQLKMITSKKAKEYYCNFDNDSAGREPNIEMAKQISEMCPDAIVYLLFLPEGEDAADYGEKKYKEYLMDNRQIFAGSAYHKLYSYFGSIT